MRPLVSSLLFLPFFISTVGMASPGMTERPARTSSRDVKIPRGLVVYIENEYKKFLADQGVSAEEGLKRQLMDITAELTHDRGSALHEDVKVVTPLGGGVVDLNEFVTPLRGAFWIRLAAKRDNGTEPEGMRVFFVSRAKQRDIEGEKLGAGCDRFMEVTSFFQNKMSGRGIELYSSDQRYLSVLGGTFVVTDFDKSKLHVASISFTDSRYPHLLCE